jgi:hypothetical protein
VGRFFADALSIRNHAVVIAGLVPAIPLRGCAGAMSWITGSRRFASVR